MSPRAPAPAAPGVLFARSATDRVVAGVAGGLAAWLDVRPIVVRAGFVVLTAAAGPAVALLYGLAWVLSGEPVEQADDEREQRAPLTAPQLAGLVLMMLGALLLLRSLGLWLGDALVWPLALAAFGSAVIWARGDELGVRMPAGQVRRVVDGPGGLLRVAAGAVLVVVGLGTFLAANDQWVAVSGVVTAVVVTVLGLGLILGPWGWRLAQQLARERRERIRSEERAEMAAHLHDSVLHTLALIQRSGSEPEMAGLARAQERELRRWLYGGHRGQAAATLADALEALAGRVERQHGAAVEVVVVGGDRPLDDRLRALVDACGEAAVNAARHSGDDRVSVYVEADGTQVTAYVKDEGKGFDPAEVPADRHGIASSIRGRMQRHGGDAFVTSSPGDGTEVQLDLPGVSA